MHKINKLMVTLVAFMVLTTMSFAKEFLGVNRSICANSKGKTFAQTPKFDLPRAKEPKVKTCRKTPSRKEGAKTMLVTVTFYWAEGSGTDCWSRAGKSSTGERLREGRSAAVDPKIIPYGSELQIEGVGKRVAHDTGSDVIGRKASRNRGCSVPVIDVFFQNKKDALQFAREFEQKYPKSQTYAYVQL